jgi:hypothetical protein
MFAELLAEDPAEEAPASDDAPALEIVVVDVVIRARTGTDEGLLAQAIRAVRAATT